MEFVYFYGGKGKISEKLDRVRFQRERGRNKIVCNTLVKVGSWGVKVVLGKDYKRVRIITCDFRACR